MTAVIPGWMPANRGNQKLHWAQRRKLDMQAKECAYWHAKEAGWVPVDGPAALHIVLVVHRGPLPDVDNAYARVKPLVDGLKSFIVDDSPRWLTLTVECRRGSEKAVEMSLTSCIGGYPDATA